MKCPNCYKEIKDNAKFCRYCGTKIETHHKQVKCPKCGFENQAQARICKKCGKNIKQNNNTKKWAAILSAIAICLVFFIAAAGINNDNNEYGVTFEPENQNSASGVHLTIHNGDWGDTFKKGNPIMVVMKDTANWESMTGCVVSVNLKNKETGDEYDIDCTITENSYGYIDTDELPLGEYEVYASYYADEDHYVNYYTDIEIVD